LPGPAVVTAIRHACDAATHEAAWTVKALLGGFGVDPGAPGVVCAVHWTASNHVGELALPAAAGTTVKLPLTAATVSTFTVSCPGGSGLGGSSASCVPGGRFCREREPESPWIVMSWIVVPPTPTAKPPCCGAVEGTAIVKAYDVPLPEAVQLSPDGAATAGAVAATRPAAAIAPAHTALPRIVVRQYPLRAVCEPDDVPLYLREADVAELLTPEDALAAVEASFERLARGSVDILPRERMRLDDGVFAVMASVDRELGYAGVKAYSWLPGGTPFAVLLFSVERARLEAVVEADTLGQLRTGAASGVAARHLARSGASSLGVIGCGWQAASQVACVRAALPAIERVVVYCRSADRLAAFCAEHGCEPAESHAEAAVHDVVVTATTSKDPVLRGDWLRPGALVCAVGANDPRRRELDNAVLDRAAFVCCDSRAQSQKESGDLIEPVAQGVLDWLEVHELQDVVAGELQGRGSDDDVVVFKSNGIAAWDVAAAARVVELARERGAGVEL